MDSLTKTLQNNILAAFGSKAPDNVLKAIRDASAKTGVNFAYMVQQAAAESSFNPSAKAKSSSASGLYQFIESTWMSMVNKYGDKYGIDTEGMSKKEILALRNDPKIASNMAAEFASENEQFLNDRWGGEVGSTELYLAHFMGAGGASAFLKAKDKNPLQPAADLMPQAARANRNVFFDKSGRAKSIDEVYAFFDKKFSIKDSTLPNLEDTIETRVAADASDQNDLQTLAQNDQTESVIFRTGHNMPSNHSRFTTANASFDKPAALPGQIPGNYQNMLRSPVDLMLLTQANPSSLFGDDNDNPLF
jgi:hypothetical protein